MRLLGAAPVLLFTVSTCLAQAPAAAHKASCKMNTLPATPAMLAMEQWKYKDAEQLFLSELSEHPSDDRLHAAHIRNLIALGHNDEAMKDSQAFVTASPNSTYARVSMADVMFRNGKLPESYMEEAKIQKDDPCNARVYESLGAYESVIGKFAMAKRHIDVAHALDPQDAEIARDWIAFQPKATRLETAKKFVQSSPAYTEENRERILKSIERAQNKPAGEECKLVSGQTSATIQFLPIMNGPDSDPEYGLEVSFNGKKRRLELDSGASGITLVARAAQGLNLTTESNSKIGGVGDGGGMDSAISHVSSIKIGDLEFSNCEVESLVAKAFSTNSTRNASGNYGAYSTDGLIGADVFQKFLVALDFPGGKIDLSPLPMRPGESAGTASLTSTSDDKPLASKSGSDNFLDSYRDPSMSEWSEFYRFGHMIIVPTVIGNAGKPSQQHLMLVDTGASMDAITPEAAREVTSVSTTGRISTYGLSGRTKQVYLTGKLILHFGNLYLPLDWMTAQSNKSISDSVGTEVTGFIGFPTLRQMTVTIDYRDRLINFNYDPKRKYDPRFQPKCYAGENCKHFGS